jgi:cell division protein FtsZ
VSAGLKGARTVAVNTDRDHLARTSCDARLLLGDGAIRSTGGRPEVGERLVARHEKDVRTFVSGGDLTFVIAGLGGGAGTGIAPIVAQWARMSGALVVGVATTPFRAERNRQDVARQGVHALREACNSLIVLDNDRLLARVPDLPLDQAFAVMDHLIGEVIRGISGALLEPSLIHLDFPDLREILAEGGTSTLLFGEGDGRDPDSVVAAALRNSLLDADLSGASGAIIHVTSGPDVSLRSVHHLVDGLTEHIRPAARVAFGIRTDPEFEGALRVMTVLTGVRARSMAASVPPGGEFDVPIA